MKSLLLALLLVSTTAMAQYPNQDPALSPGEQLVYPTHASHDVRQYTTPTRGLIYPHTAENMPVYDVSQSAYARSIHQTSSTDYGTNHVKNLLRAFSRW
jgi:hypothetical protein